MPDEFYIGYATQVPRGVAWATKRAVIALLALAVGGCGLLIFAQQPFARSIFEFQQFRDFAGTVQTEPWPALLVSRPGGTSFSRYLLVAPGKHGAAAEVAGFAARRVTLRGELIYRDGQTMIQVAPGSMKADGGPVIHDPVGASVETTLVGEIVDSKCFLGVMNPGRTKVHRDCAARCIAGGIPPMLVTADGNYLLVNVKGIGFVGEPVEVQGQVERSGESLIFRVRNIRRRE